jgi:hypothetical protein
VPPALGVATRAATQRGPGVFLPAVEAEVTAASGSGPQSFGRAGVVQEARVCCDMA